MRRKSGVALGAVAAGIMLIAGQASEVRAALTYDFSLGAGVFVNDNFYLDPESGPEGQRKPVNETMYAIAPALNLNWIGQFDHLRGDYRGEYWQFTGDEDLDPRWVHNLTADLAWRRWAPFFIEVRETLERGPSAQGRDVEAVIDYTYTNTVSARTGLVWKFGTRGTVELAYRGEFETYPQVVDADRVLRQYGEGLARYRWTPLLESEFRVSYGQVERELTADYDELNASVAVDQRLSEHLALRYRLEWFRNAYDAPPGEGVAPDAQGPTVSTGLLGGAEVRGDLSLGGTWKLGFSDDLDYLVDGDTLETRRTSAEVALRARLGSTLTVGGWYETRDYRVSGREETAWGPTLDARWMITPRIACEVRGHWTDTTIREAALAEVDEQTSWAAAGLVFMLFNRLQLEAGYDYRNNDSSDAQRSYSGSRLYAFVTYYFRPLVPGVIPSSYLSRLDDNPGGVDSQR
jgi:hypothetical protein